MLGPVPPHRLSNAGALLRDPIVQLAAWIAALIGATYAVPLLTPEELAAFGVSRFEIPFVGVAAGAAFYRIDRIADRDERRFWVTLGTGTLLWLATVILVTFFPRANNNAVSDAAVAAGYVSFYVAFMAAAEQTPHVPRVVGHIPVANRIATAGLVLISLCWFAYFVIVPVMVDPTLPGVLSSAGPLFVILDAIVVARFTALACGSLSRRWRIQYAAIAVAMAAALVTDILDTQAAKQLVFIERGSGAGLLWALPPLCLLLAFRTRHVAWRASEPAPSGADTRRDNEPTRVALRLWALAALFPFVHAGLRDVGLLDPAVESAQQWTAIAAMTGTGIAAGVSYRWLERRRAAAAAMRAALEERLRDAKTMEATARLAGVVTHEFLNLLNAIGGYVDLTLDSLSTDDPSADNLKRAHAVVRRTTAFTNRLLILSRGEPYHRTAVSLNRTVNDLLQELRGALAPPAVVEAVFGEGDCDVAIAAEHLREILLPIATNAGEALTQGGRLTIETETMELSPQEAIARAVRPGRYGRVVMRDTGTGMPKEVLAHAFEPFFTTKPKPHARGLGLATAYVLVTRHGGSIAIASELGVGTTVDFLIPAR
jgi:signal transduction histidine kinase